MDIDRLINRHPRLRAASDAANKAARREGDALRALEKASAAYSAAHAKFLQILGEVQEADARAAEDKAFHKASRKARGQSTDQQIRLADRALRGKR